ncbi:MAG: metallophosphoesterase [Cyclobacteriaceae bacterium]
MTRIGIISDTHNYLDPIMQDHFKDCDQIWHAGDIGDYLIIEQLDQIAPTKGVYGNIDNGKSRTELPEYRFFTVEKLRVLLIHIAGNPKRYVPRVNQLIKKLDPQLLVCGHSHLIRVEKDDKHNGMVYINPGAAGKHGFHKMKTAINMTLHQGKITEMKVIELGLRGKVVD